MAKEKKVNISSSNATGLNDLYQIYQSHDGNENAAYDEFIQFLSVASPERSIFFEKYCNWEALDMGITIVIKVDPK